MSVIRKLQRHGCIFLSNVSYFMSPELFVSRRQCSEILFASLQQTRLDPLITDEAPRLSFRRCSQIAIVHQVPPDCLGRESD